MTLGVFNLSIHELEVTQRKLRPFREPTRGKFSCSQCIVALPFTSLLCAPYAVHKCGQAGTRVGQGTGFEYMTSPWLQYEAYGMKMTNNVIYDVWGAGLGVVGGYSVLVAHNSLYK